MPQRNERRITPPEVRDFFGVTSKELIEMKKLDPDGYEEIVQGMSDGSFTY